MRDEHLAGARLLVGEEKHRQPYRSRDRKQTRDHCLGHDGKRGPKVQINRQVKRQDNERENSLPPNTAKSASWIVGARFDDQTAAIPFADTLAGPQASLHKVQPNTSAWFSPPENDKQGRSVSSEGWKTRDKKKQRRGAVEEGSTDSTPKAPRGLGRRSQGVVGPQRSRALVLLSRSYLSRPGYPLQLQSCGQIFPARVPDRPLSVQPGDL